MSSQRDVKNRISSVQNIRKITRAMEMVAAARLRKAEQRIVDLRPYAETLRRMTSQAARAAGSGEIRANPLLADREERRTVAIVLVTADRGLAGAFNSQILRAGLRRASELRAEGVDVVWHAVGRRSVGSLGFRGQELAGQYTGFTDDPEYGDAREIGENVTSAFVDEDVDRVEVFYNVFVSALTQTVRHETLLPLAAATLEEPSGEAGDDEDGGDADEGAGHRALVEYEPGPAEILERLVPDYVEVSLYRALLDSSAAEHGARMTAMRSASDNAGEVIETLTLEMNRARQAEITQEIMEVVGGAEALN